MPPKNFVPDMSNEITAQELVDAIMQAANGRPLERFAVVCHESSGFLMLDIETADSVNLNLYSDKLND